MAWRLLLDRELKVERDGSDCGPVPNPTVGMLLIGLASNGDQFTTRASIARQLYPESDSVDAGNAFRQSLLRLRRWLGDDAIEQDSNRLRLAHGKWEVTPNVFVGAKIEGKFMAPDIDHPWLDRLRETWRSDGKTNPDAMIGNYIAAIDGVAELDADVARSLLVGGRGLIARVSLQEVGRLLAKTRFKDRRDPFVLDHLEIQGMFHLRNLLVHESMAAYMRAYRMAAHARSGSDQARMAAFVAYVLIEIGDMRGAESWIGRVNENRASASRLFLANCRGSFEWNAGQFPEALVTMREAARLVPSADRASQLHFWSNYAALAAEAGEITLSESISQIAQDLLIREMDVMAIGCLELAFGTRLLALGEAPEAVKVFENLVFLGQETDWPATTLYAQDALAEALAAAGDLSRARQLWALVERARAGLLSPRLIARKRRIRAYGA